MIIIAFVPRRHAHHFDAVLDDPKGFSGILNGTFSQIGRLKTQCRSDIRRRHAGGHDGNLHTFRHILAYLRQVSRKYRVWVSEYHALWHSPSARVSQRPRSASLRYGDRQPRYCKCRTTQPMPARPQPAGRSTRLHGSVARRVWFPRQNQIRIPATTSDSRTLPPASRVKSAVLPNLRLHATPR